MLIGDFSIPFILFSMVFGGSLSSVNVSISGMSCRYSSKFRTAIDESQRIHFFLFNSEVLLFVN